MTTLSYQEGVPGVSDLDQSDEIALTWGPYWHRQIVIDKTTVDARSTGETNVLLLGLVLGEVTATKKFKQYDPTASDGTEIARLILAQHVNTKNQPKSVTGDIVTIGIQTGHIQASGCGGLDQQARGQLTNAIFFDDGFQGAHQGSHLSVIAKTADYTVLEGDRGKIITTEGATGAVNFTLPAIDRGLNFRFHAVANQNMTLTSATADTLIAFNDEAADSVTLSTASEKTGGHFQVVANHDETKWLVIPMLWDGQTATIAT